MNSNTLIGAVHELAETIKTPLDQIAAAIGVGPGFEPPKDAYSDPGREEILIRYTVGTGHWDKNKKYNVLLMKMFNMDGSADGSHDGVWQPVVKKPEDLFVKPPAPNPPFDEPKGPVPETSPRAYTKAIWQFGDGSSITAVGPAMLYLQKYSDDSHIFLVAVSAIITNGTGKYEGARGVKTALGSTFVPKGANIFDAPPDKPFGAVTVETFRVIRAPYL